MRKQIGRAVLVMALAVLFLMPAIALTIRDAEAGQAQDLLRQADKLMRQASRDMFSGKKDQAVTSALKARELIGQAETAEPSNPRVATAKKKLQKLIRDLERRTGQDLGGGSATARASASGATSLPPTRATGSSDKPAKLPYHARQAVSGLDNEFRMLERDISKIADPAYKHDKKQIIERVPKRFAIIREALAKGREEAKKKGMESHPLFDQIQARLAEDEKKFAAAQASHGQQSAAAAANEGEVNADVKALRELYDKVQPVFAKATGTVIYYNDMKPVQELLVVIQEFEKGPRAEVVAMLESFGKKYGQSAADIDKKTQAMGYSGQGRAGYAYEELAGGLKKVAKTRQVMAVDLHKRAQDTLARLTKGTHDFYKVKMSGEYKKWLALAAQFDTDNAQVKEALAKADQAVAGALKEFLAQVDGRKWSGHSDKAPSNVDELAKAAMAWFSGHQGWGKHPKDPRRPLAVAVIGPWSIQKKNIKGETIMYGLPVLVAVQVDSEKDGNLARVYSLTLRTNEARGVKMAPPFNHATVGNSYYIRPGAVK